MEDLAILKSHPYISENIQIQKFNSPFNYVIIDNFFKDDIYFQLSEKFYEYISRTNRPNGQTGDSGGFYDAFIYGLQGYDCNHGYDFFLSKEWHQFNSNLFSIELNEYIACTLHYHQGSKENPSKDGWPHTDLNIVSVLDDQNKELKLVGGCDYTDNTFDAQPHTKKCLRSIAALYYFNNKLNLEDGDGGGTDIYSTYSKESFIEEVKPINNRMFIFEIGPKSYHGFHGAKFNRSAIVQWFHSSPSYILKRNFSLFKSERLDKGSSFFEYWKEKNAWEVDRDPDYSKYFDIPYSELCKKNKK
jgi:hypothetical protein